MILHKNITFSTLIIFSVGSMHDFRHTPGLANLLGHLLLIRSKKYPQNFGFQKFLDARGNTRPRVLTTNVSKQTFSFDISSNHLLSAIDRWVLCILMTNRMIDTSKFCLFSFF